MRLIPLEVPNTAGKHRPEANNSSERSLEGRRVRPFFPESVLVLLVAFALILGARLARGKVIARPNGGLRDGRVRPLRDVARDDARV